MPLYAASYPILAKAQKPGGVTVLATVTGGDVPNKPTYAAGTIQSLEEGVEEDAGEGGEEGAGVEGAMAPMSAPLGAEPEEEEEEEEEE